MQPHPSTSLVALVAVAIVAIAAVLAIVALRVALAPNDPYLSSRSAGVTPVRTSEDIAGLARGYLDAQAAKLAAPELHELPDVVEIVAIPASEVRSRLPRIPTSAVTSEPGRVVWVARVAGDVFATEARAWSPADYPAPCGHLVVDDTTLELLAVFPEACPAR